jgi:hypothetical protein
MYIRLERYIKGFRSVMMSPRLLLVVFLTTVILPAAVFSENLRGIYHYNYETKRSSVTISGQKFNLTLPSGSDRILSGSRVALEGTFSSNSEFIASDIHLEIPTQPTSGIRKAVIFLIRFQDSEAIDDSSLIEGASSTFDALRRYFEEVSGGTLSFQFRLVGPLTVSIPASGCNNLPIDTFDELASRASINVDEYDHVLNVFQKAACSFDAYAITGGRASYFNLDFKSLSSRKGTFAHELLHNLGLDHSSLLRCPNGQTTLEGVCEREGYQDYLDVMGIANRRDGSPFGMHVWERSALGWLAEDRIASVDSPTNAGIFELAPASSTTGLAAIRIPKGKLNVFNTRDVGPNQKYDYWISFRAPVGSDLSDRNETAGWQRGAIIHLAPRYPSSFISIPTYGESFLVPTSRSGLMNQDGVALLEGQTYEDRSSGLVVRTLKHTFDQMNPSNSRLKVQICLPGSDCPALESPPQNLPPKKTTPHLTFNVSSVKGVVGKKFPKLFGIIHGELDQPCKVTPTLPNGLKLNAKTCAVTGKATRASKARNFIFTVSNSAGSESVPVKIMITKARPK